MAYKLIITEKTEGLLDNLVYHVPDRGSFVYVTGIFHQLENYREKV